MQVITKHRCVACEGPNVLVKAISDSVSVAKCLNCGYEREMER